MLLSDAHSFFREKVQNLSIFKVQPRLYIDLKDFRYESNILPYELSPLASTWCNPSDLSLFYTKVSVPAE